MEPRELIDKLQRQRHLTPDEYATLVENHDRQEWLSAANESARAVADSVFGRGVFIRALVEISNHCCNNCFYCGLRRDNSLVERYRMTPEAILATCIDGYNRGFRTFVLQGGEDAYYTDQMLTDLIVDLRSACPEAAITLSLGERPEESYRQLFEAGASRYLLRHETIDSRHYRTLHPAEMSLERRLNCLKNLKRIGYQTGTGMMVGSPMQHTEQIVQDIRFIEQFEPQMIGIGPFIPQSQTPMAAHPHGSITLTLMLISIFRLMFPSTLIPSTTALGTISPQARLDGIMAGANVLMPNLSPPAQRHKYAIYDKKLSDGLEAAESLTQIDRELHTIGYRINYGRGDWCEMQSPAPIQ